MGIPFLDVPVMHHRRKQIQTLNSGSGDRVAIVGTVSGPCETFKIGDMDVPRCVGEEMEATSKEWNLGLYKKPARGQPNSPQVSCSVSAHAKRILPRIDIKKRGTDN